MTTPPELLRRAAEIMRICRRNSGNGVLSFMVEIEDTADSLVKLAQALEEPTWEMTQAMITAGAEFSEQGGGHAGPWLRRYLESQFVAAIGTALAEGKA